ncbi:hypothetical protein FNL37_0549 [Methylovorus glucosotrophus]|uniref:hypothetical protein n=1 Tax=Methylovorus glucosotrophus TaxID=266009 RepID=UPI0013311E17|nr:hypothetical protein [Methylovorus glucosotrophus]KAF0843132.1 hypothetical protein FNL37_0549 [Methylovorus glucosotrophus]
MLQAIQEFGIFLDYCLNWVTTALVLSCALWILVTHFWVYRRGGLAGVLRWHRNTKRICGFNDTAYSSAILGLSVVVLAVNMNTPSFFGVTTGLLLNGMLFLVIAILFGERRKHWQFLKSSACEVILRPYQ